MGISDSLAFAGFDCFLHLHGLVCQGDTSGIAEISIETNVGPVKVAAVSTDALVGGTAKVNFGYLDRSQFLSDSEDVRAYRWGYIGIVW